jgi:hypothetical protein
LGGWGFVRGRLPETPILKIVSVRAPRICIFYSVSLGQVTNEEALAGFGRRFFCFILIFVSFF